MTPEERERFKEAEKEHLRQLKKLKEQARLAQRRASVNKALSDMAGALKQDDDPLDDHTEMMDRLAIHAEQEAIEEKAHAGIIPHGVAEVMLEEMAHELWELRASQATKLAIDPHSMHRAPWVASCCSSGSVKISP